MDGVRYWLAWFLVVFLPAAILYWFAIHPFAAFWRRVGRWAGMAAGMVTMAGSALVMGVCAPVLLRIDYGLSWPLVVLGLVFEAFAVWISIQRRRHLTSRILMGVPELAKEPGESVLLTQGIYSRIRHPRYLEVIFAAAAFALVANYLAGYLVLVFSILGIYLVVLLEERELHQRFGAAWEAYAARTPRFIPRGR